MGGRYEIYEDGRIWSFFKNDWMTPTVRKNGYAGVSFRDESGKRCCRNHHRMVYEVFRGLVPQGKEINHIDGMKLNNSLDNLEAVTSQENKKHAWSLGLYHPPIGEALPFTKLSDIQVNEIRQLYLNGWKRTPLAKRFGVSYPTIHRIISRKRRQYVE